MGVAVPSCSADLTRGKGSFNTLMGLFATALAIGGVAGPSLSGVLVHASRLPPDLLRFRRDGCLGAEIFTIFVPQTRALAGVSKAGTTRPDPEVADSEAA